ncbi:hypothetical protein LCGC14_2050390 [marine sediment metagenome]|uniref:Uncharacterized protein n=1 Tax=marine sediment metagenome TaxID=412755 RepID=A0A0F9EPB6_9ZZZZ
METLTKKEAMYKRIEGYGINLNKFKRGDKASLSNAEAIYKGGFRAE